MYIYDYQAGLSLEDLNVLGADNWEITGIMIYTSPSSYDVFIRKGFQEKTLIENSETGAKFWINETISYGEAFVIFFIVVLTIAVITKAIFKFFS